MYQKKDYFNVYEFLEVQIHAFVAKLGKRFHGKKALYCGIFLPTSDPPEILEILPEIISKLRQFCDIEKGIKRNSI